MLHTNYVQNKGIFLKLPNYFNALKAIKHKLTRKYGLETTKQEEKDNYQPRKRQMTESHCHLPICQRLSRFLVSRLLLPGNGDHGHGIGFERDRGAADTSRLHLCLLVTGLSAETYGLCT